MHNVYLTLAAATEDVNTALCFLSTTEIRVRRALIFMCRERTGAAETESEQYRVPSNRLCSSYFTPLFPLRAGSDRETSEPAVSDGR